MAEESAIEWTDATVNFWWGCTKVGPGCDHCYAETWARRTGSPAWGIGEPRRKIKSARALILRLQNSYSWFYADHGRRRRVFIQSMSDLFDTEVPTEWFEEAWGLIELCSNLSLQIVTKRVSVIEKRLEAIGKTAWPKHAGLLISVVNQDEADRDVPRLLALKAKFGIPWVGLSAEPLLGPLDLRRVTPKGRDFIDALTGHDFDQCHTGPRIDWVIAGGESGPHARPMHPGWARSLRDQCAAAGVPFLFKQWGEWAAHGYKPEGFNGADHFWPLENGRGPISYRVGKKAAGRRLDGRTHDGYPEPAPTALAVA